MAETSPLAPAPAAGQSPALELLPAKVSDRFIAYFLDLLPFLAGFGVTLYVVLIRLQSLPATPEAARGLGVPWAVLLLLYQLVGNLTGGTVGKRLMGLKVVRRDGSSLGFWRSLARTFAWVLSTPLCNFGFLVAFVHPDSRTLHDILSGALVVETRAKDTAEAFVLFLGAACAVFGLFLGNVYYTLNQPLPSDLLAVQKAQEGIKILAGVQEAYKAKNGAYTKTLEDLVQASGDPEEFRKAMVEIFDPNLFRVQVGKGKYRISGAAKDRRKTRVSIEGPLPPPSASLPR